MDDNNFSNSGYKGSKKFNQQEIVTANATGFGAAADDYMERGIDLNEQLIKNKPATFFFRMQSDAMSGAGIAKGDEVIVDRSLKPVHGKVVVAEHEGLLIVRRFHKLKEEIILKAENENYPDIPVKQSNERLFVWGVVTYVIHVP